MKAFIVAALLVAAVAGQSTMDILKMNKERELFKKFDRPMTSELLLKKLGYPMEKTYFGDNVDMPLYMQEELLNKKVLNIEELYQTELFREYMSLPLFRQYFTYPAFQKYVTSTYFQKFWQIPTFKQYFLNPVFFYKYIYPIVNLFKTEMTIPTTVFGDEMIKGRDMIVNKNVYPFVTGFERDLLKDNTFVPTLYNEDLKLKDDLKAKYLLTKIYSHLYNIPEEYIKEQFLTKKMIVDPITGEYKYINEKYNTFPVDTTFKNFDTTVFGDKIHYPVDTFKTMESTMYGDKLVKDVLLKKLLLNKMMKDETYKTMDFNTYGEDKIVKDVLIKKLLNKMIKEETFKTMDFNTFGEDKLVKDVLLKKLLLNKMIKDETTFKTQIPEEFILREKMMKMNPMVARMMYGYNKLPVYNKFETIDTIDKMNMFDIKKDLIKEDFLPIALKKELLLKDKILYNKIFNDKVNEIENFETYEHVPKVVDFTTPMMGVRTFDKKFYPETIIKA